MECQGSFENCIKCNMIGNQQYYLNDTDATNLNAGGVCIPSCDVGYYQD